MREAIGSTWLIGIVVTFIAIFSGFLAYSISYTKAFRVKNEIIKLIGVGGAGGNAVNYAHNIGINGVNYVICNTDLQALKDSDVEIKIQLGPRLTEGLGAGNNPEQGRASAEEVIDDINNMLDDTKISIICAGIGRWHWHWRCACHSQKI